MRPRSSRRKFYLVIKFALYYPRFSWKHGPCAVAPAHYCVMSELRKKKQKQNTKKKKSGCAWTSDLVIFHAVFKVRNKFVTWSRLENFNDSENRGFLAGYRKLDGHLAWLSVLSLLRWFILKLYNGRNFIIFFIGKHMLNPLQYFIMFF